MAINLHPQSYKNADPDRLKAQRDWKGKIFELIYEKQRHAMTGVNETHERKRSTGVAETERDRLCKDPCFFGDSKVK